MSILILIIAGCPHLSVVLTEMQETILIEKKTEILMKKHLIIIQAFTRPNYSLIFMTMIISLFLDDNIYSLTAILTYGPPTNTLTLLIIAAYYLTIF